MLRVLNKIFFLLLLFTTLFCSAQKEKKFEGFKDRKIPFKQNVIKWNLIPVFVGQIPLCGELRFTYERMLTHNQSLTVGVSYNFPSIPFVLVPSAMNSRRFGIKDFSMRGGRFTLGYRYYPKKNKDAPQGVFTGPYGSLNFVKIKERNGSGNFETIYYTNVSWIAGYQVHLRHGVMFEFFGGLGYKKNFIRAYNAQYNSYSQQDFDLFERTPLRILKNVKITLQVNVGFGW